VPCVRLPLDKQALLAAANASKREADGPTSTPDDSSATTEERNWAWASTTGPTCREYARSRARALAGIMKAIPDALAAGEIKQRW